MTALLNFLARIAPGLTGRIAFFLFCFPRPKRLKEKEARFLADARTSTVRVNGRKYAIHEWGTGDRLAILAHGWESHSGRWRKLTPMLLKAGYRVLALDAPAHGQSPGVRFTMLEYAQAITCLLQHHGPAALLVGHSVGASSAIWAMSETAAAHLPARALLLCPFSTLRYTLEKSARQLGIGEGVMNALAHRIYLFSGHTLEQIDLAERAAAIKGVNALLIHDKGDKVTAFSESERIVARWQEAQLTLTNGCGHGLTAPEAYKIMDGFIGPDNTIPAPPSHP